MGSVYTAKLALARGRVERAWVLIFGTEKSASLGGIAFVTFMPFRRLSLQTDTENAVFL